MSRTYRRRGQRHEYRWVLRDSTWINGFLVPRFIDARSKEGRCAIARFHSDAYWTGGNRTRYGDYAGPCILACDSTTASTRATADSRCAWTIRPARSPSRAASALKISSCCRQTSLPSSLD